MLTKDFLCKREVLGKRSPHSFTPPPPPSKCGRCVQQMDDEIPILYEENYSTWIREMTVYLKTMGATIWKAAIGGSILLKNKSKFAVQREGKKNDAFSLKTILCGLSSPIKESMGKFTSTKDLWLKLEETYQKKKEHVEEHSVKIIKGK
jgi:hypothetical protein